MAHRILKKETHKKQDLMKKESLEITVDTPQPEPLTFSIGTVTQGENPEVKNVGYGNNVILNFKLPTNVTATPYNYPLGLSYIGPSNLTVDNKINFDNKANYFLQIQSDPNKTEIRGINGGSTGLTIQLRLAQGYILKNSNFFILHNQEDIANCDDRKIMTFLCLYPGNWIEISRNWLDLVNPFVKIASEQEYEALETKDPDTIYLITGD